MCGIFGGSISLTSVNNAERCLDALNFRGPDDRGVWRNDNFLLGMTRLAIQDLSGGQQPMASLNKRYIIVFNGELYEFDSLKNKLVTLGYDFQTKSSDTEVLLNTFQEFGIMTPNLVSGMFSFCVYDKDEKNAYVFRDHAGIKPLYYYCDDQVFYFASEIKGLLNYNSLEIKFPNDFISYYQKKSFYRHENIFKGVSELPPGHYLKYSVIDGSLQIKQWYDFSKNIYIGRIPSESSLVNKLDDILKRSVESHLRAEVEVGTFLSGGVDSSLITAIASELLAKKQKKVKTFTLTYESGLAEGKDQDRYFAKIVSDLYHTSHYEQELGPHEVLAGIRNVMEAFDQPFSGVTSTYYLTKIIGKHVKVALSGDGADEIFGSYLQHRLAGLYDTLKSKLPKGTNDYQKYKINANQYSRYRTLGLYDKLDFNRVWSDEELKKLLKNKISEQIFIKNSNFIKNQICDNTSKDMMLRKTLMYDVKTLLVDQILRYVDHLSMRNSVEVRPPFLDRELMDFALNINPTFQMKFGEEKYILKRVAERYLPHELVYRKKEGFVLPIDQWLRYDLDEDMKKILLEASENIYKYYDKAYINELIYQHINGISNHGQKLWNLINIFQWYEFNAMAELR